MFFGFLIFTSVSLLCISLFAQISSTVLGEFEDWSAYSFRDSENDLVCYMLSEPIKQEFYRCPAREVPGKHCPEVDVQEIKRSFTYAMIRHVPYKLSFNVPSFDIGYTFADRAFSKVTVTVGTEIFEFSLITQDRHSWTLSNEEDKRLTEKIRDGLTMTVEGISNRGTYTVDTYSLRGSKDALHAIDRACHTTREEQSNKIPE